MSAPKQNDKLATMPEYTYGSFLILNWVTNIDQISQIYTNLCKYLSEHNLEHLNYEYRESCYQGTPQHPREHVSLWQVSLHHMFLNMGNTVNQEMLVAIIFGGFENITIWQRFNLEISLEESGRGPYFFIWWQLILAKCIKNSPISPNKYLPIIDHFTV